MAKKLLIIITLSWALAACSGGEEQDLKPDDLLGVWSGLLFQTESPYDSALVDLTREPSELLLYKNEELTTLPITRQGEVLFAKGSGGLRFDGFMDQDHQLQGILTHNLWAKTLDFSGVENRWVAPVHKPEIIDTDYQVYLEFYQDFLGELQAYIQSNKENRALHFLIEEVSVKGNSIRFSITNPRFSLAATYDAQNQELALTYGNVGGKRTVSLTRLPENQWGGYLPRSKTEPYTYHIPQSPGAWLPAAPLNEVGIDPSVLDFLGAVKQGRYPHLHSVIITKDQKLVLEEYFHGYHRDYLHDIRSAFKSFASLTLGKTMMQDASLTVDSRILDFYPDYGGDEAEKHGITVGHALTMSTGLQLEDEDEMQWEHPDWVQHKLGLPLVHAPGKAFEYSSGGTHLLSGVMQQATGTYLPLFLYQEVLHPMGIHQFQMLTSPMGRGYLAGNFYLRPIDFTRFGLLVLNDGQWAGEPLIDAAWIQESTSPQIINTYPQGSDYGYLWRLLDRPVGSRQVRTIEAWGNGGQYLIIIPEWNMTVTFTAGNYNLFPEMEIPLEILEEYILPAVQAD
ncbi:MAG TPA: serine hydrolase [Cytophagales bacterium]|nr:serine hydrolase [Cytophagales bacterium]